MLIGPRRQGDLFPDHRLRADIEAKKLAATVETPYVIASISKWLTSTALLKLAEGAGSIWTRRSRPICLTTASTYRGQGQAAPPDDQRQRDPERLYDLDQGSSGSDLFKKPMTTAEAVRLWCSGDLTFEPGTEVRLRPDQLGDHHRDHRDGDRQGLCRRHVRDW
ncbi:hypothetical protein ACRAWD_03705 [Caulobacter segnis]